MFQYKVQGHFITIFLCALAAIMTFGIGCQQGGKKVEMPQKMTIAYSTAYNAVLVHIAIANDYFSQEGLEVTAQAHDFGKLALQSVTDGKADVATAADTPVMFAAMNGKKTAIIAAIETSNRNAAIIARRDRGIARPSDLNGKTIGVTRGTTSDFFTEAFLIDQGIDKNRVRIIDVLPSEMAKAISTGKIDAATLWNPGLVQLQEMLGDKGQTFYGEMLYTETFCAVAAQNFVQNHPKAIQNFLRALIRAEKFAYEHPEEARRRVATFLHTDQTILNQVWNVYNFRVTLDQALIVDLEDQSRWAIKSRLVAAKEVPNYLDYIYIDGLQSVRPGMVTLIR